MAVTQTLTLTEVAGSANHASNTSQVRILWKSAQSGDSHNDYERTAKYYVSINGGAEVEYSVSYTLPQNTTKTIVDTTITVTHKSDGSGSVSVRTWMDTKISAGVVSKEESLTLTTIPRASTIDYLSCATKYFNGKFTYKYTPKNSKYYNRCNISLKIDGEYIGVTSILLGKQTTSQKTATVTFTKDELSTIYNELPKTTTKGTLRFTFCTYSDSEYSTQIGDISYKEITLYIPDIDDTKPTATMTLSPVTSLGSPFDALYIMGRSKVKASFSNEEGKYGTDIVSHEMRINAKSYASPYTSDYLSTGSVTVKGIVTNSRGFSREYEETITVIPYGKPKLLPASDESEIICARCDGDKNLTESGVNLRIKVSRSYYKVEQNNFCAIRYRCVPEGTQFTGDEGWVTLLSDTETSTDTVDAFLPEVVSSLEKAYVVQIGVIDSIGETAAVQFMIPTDFVTLDAPERHKGRKIGMFRYAPDEGEDGIYFGLPIFGAFADFVTDVGLFETDTGSWHYKKWYSGTFDLSGTFDVIPISAGTTGTAAVYYSEQIQIELPFPIETIQYTGAPAEQYCLFTNAALVSQGDAENNGKIGFRLMRFANFGEEAIPVRLVAHGRWK